MLDGVEPGRAQSQGINEQWMLKKYDYRSPAQVRRDLLGLDAAA